MSYKNKILESKRPARENELEEGKKHKLSEVFQNQEVLNPLGSHSVLWVHTSKHAHLITCTAESIAFSP